MEKISKYEIIEPDWETLSIQLQSCYDTIVKTGNIPRLGLIKNCLKINYDFTEKMYGYEKFKKLLEKLFQIYPAFNITELEKSEFMLTKIED
ncbi:hypothetical protein ES703_53210 [subsurface metagenome]|uniref:HTH OST-type domain-containing protein n=1 Tax=marine sediment metagenome TaxID=412755 RepID=X1AZD9_9ZZZZ